MPDSDITVQLRVVADQFQATMQQATENMRQFGDAVKGQAEKVSGGMAGIKKSATEVNQAFELIKKGIEIVRMAGDVILGVAGDTAQWALHLTQLSQEFDVSTSTLQRWEQVTVKTGQPIDAISQMVRKLGVSMATAREGTNEYSYILNEWGVDLNGPVTDAIYKVAAGVVNMTDKQSQLDWMNKVLGRSSAAQIPLLHELAKGKDGVTKATEGYFQAGEEEVLRLAEGAKAVSNLSNQWKSLKHALGAEGGDAYTEAVNELAGFLENVRVGAGQIESWRNKLGTWLLDIKGVRAVAETLVGGKTAPGEMQGPQLDLEAGLKPGQQVPWIDWGAKELPVPKLADQQKEENDRYKAVEAKRAAELQAIKADLKLKEDVIKNNLDTIYATTEDRVKATLAVKSDASAAELRVLAKQRVDYELHYSKLTALGFANNVTGPKALLEERKAMLARSAAEETKILAGRSEDQIKAYQEYKKFLEAQEKALGESQIANAVAVHKVKMDLLKDTETRASSHVAIGDKQMLGSVEMAERRKALIQSQIGRQEKEIPSEEGNAKLALLREDFKEQDEIAQNSFVKGWARGMKQFTRDSTGAFGQAQVMARDAAQGMQSGFETMFFDAMQGKFHSLKDVAASVLTFIQQMAAKAAGQWAMVQMMGGEGAPGGGQGLMGMGMKLAGMASGFMGGGGGEAGIAAAAARGAADPSLYGPGFAEGGFVRRHFSAGGPSGTDTIPAWLTPGEGVLSTKGMAALDKLNGGGSSMGRAVNIHMTINTPDAKGFRQSQDQILMDAHRAMARAQRNA